MTDLRAVERVGFVGLGAMGSGIAQRILDAGYAVIGWNRTKGKAEELIAGGMGWADTAREVAAQCDVVFTMLTNTAAIQATARGDELLGLGPGAVPPDHGVPRVHDPLRDPAAHRTEPDEPDPLDRAEVGHRAAQ